MRHFQDAFPLIFLTGFPVFFALTLPAFSQNPEIPPANFKVAFIADQALGTDAQAVLQLIKNEGAGAVVHCGDFDYQDDPRAWENQINAILGPNFPYFASVGNHDEDAFYIANGYQDLMEARMARLGLTWQGDLGVRSSFRFNGIFFVLVGPDIFDNNGYDLYIRSQLAQDNSLWSISSWHKNMTLMQAGNKGNETGWGVYEESRKGGAIIATGHEHSYSRTHLLSSMMNQTIASTSDTLVLTRDDTLTGDDEGRSFAFVSGLGGRSIRKQVLSGPWWASIFTSTQGANYGALFGIFNLDSIPNLAKFYFKDIDGAVPDSFYVVSQVEMLPVPVELVSFEAKVQGNTVVLSWETASETNNFGFDVERSREAKDEFAKIGFVPGAGTTTIAQNYVFTDRNLLAGNVRYRLRQIDTNGSFRYSPVLQIKINPPKSIYLSQNHPNPFNPETRIRFALPGEMHVTLKVFNILGDEVRTLVEGYQMAGVFEVKWDTRNDAGKLLPSGTYLYRLQAGGFVNVKKMALLR
jgi:predicted phosphodiesterase